MNRKLVVGGVTVGAGLLAGTCAQRCGRDGVAKLIERMPDDAPPKWMFNNITAIRENTERILRLLESERRVETGEPAPSGEEQGDATDGETVGLAA